MEGYLPVRTAAHQSAQNRRRRAARGRTMPITTLARRHALGHNCGQRKRHREPLQRDRLQPVSRLVSLTPVVGRWFQIPPPPPRRARPMPTGRARFSFAECVRGPQYAGPHASVPRSSQENPGARRSRRLGDLAAIDSISPRRRHGSCSFKYCDERAANSRSILLRFALCCPISSHSHVLCDVRRRRNRHCAATRILQMLGGALPRPVTSRVRDSQPGQQTSRLEQSKPCSKKPRPPSRLFSSSVPRPARWRSGSTQTSPIATQLALVSSPALRCLYWRPSIIKRFAPRVCGSSRESGPGSKLE